MKGGHIYLAGIMALGLVASVAMGLAVRTAIQNEGLRTANYFYSRDLIRCHIVDGVLQAMPTKESSRWRDDAPKPAEKADQPKKK